MQIAIDGPSASGKSTIAKMLAEQLNITYLDTGAMYRAITYAVINQQINIDHTTDLISLLDSLAIQFKYTDQGQRTFLNQEDITDAIRSKKITENVSKVASIALVREFAVHLQRQIAENQSVVMDGRDIGTVVLPQADFKFYFVADPVVRAQRRFDENKKKNIETTTLDEMIADIKKRDHLDMTREQSPLKKAQDAYEIDTSQLSPDEVVLKILSIINAPND